MTSSEAGECRSVTGFQLNSRGYKGKLIPQCGALTAASAAPGNSSELPVLRLQPRPTEAETLGGAQPWGL